MTISFTTGFGGGAGSGSGGFGGSLGGGAGFAGAGFGATDLGIETICTITGEEEMSMALLGGRSTSARKTITCPASENASSRRKARLCSKLSVGT